MSIDEKKKVVRLFRRVSPAIGEVSSLVNCANDGGKEKIDPKKEEKKTEKNKKRGRVNVADMPSTSTTTSTKSNDKKTKKCKLSAPERKQLAAEKLEHEKKQLEDAEREAHAAKLDPLSQLGSLLHHVVGAGAMTRSHLQKAQVEMESSKALILANCVSTDPVMQRVAQQHQVKFRAAERLVTSLLPQEVIWQQRELLMERIFAAQDQIRMVLEGEKGKVPLKPTTTEKITFDPPPRGKKAVEPTTAKPSDNLVHGSTIVESGPFPSNGTSNE